MKSISIRILANKNPAYALISIRACTAIVYKDRKETKDMDIDGHVAELSNLARKASEINPNDLLSGFMEEHTKIVIYGAGAVGRNCINFSKNINDTNFEITCFLDRNADLKPKYCGYPVYKPDDPCLSVDFRKEAVVILALWLPIADYPKLEKELRALGYTKFVNAMHQLGVIIGDSYYESKGRQFFIQETDQILAAYKLMYDDHSRNVFYAIFRAYSLFDYNLPVLSLGMEQYVNVQIHFRHGFRNFVDCGAFTGDTLESLAKHHSVKCYFGLEPNFDNFVKLVRTYDKLKDKVEKAVFLPIGAGINNEFLQFAGSGETGKVDASGNKIIHIVSLDNILKGYNNLMIKMDIEGAETLALLGARKTITETKPDLAICLYHKAEDLWHIPNLLHEWVPEYKFYIRNHESETFETVLYATI